MRNDSATGWASRSLDESLQQAEARGMGAWQAFMIGAAAASELTIALWIVILAHLAVAALSTLIVRRGAKAWPLLVAIYAVTLLDYRAVVEASSVLFLMTLWTSILTTAIPVLLVDRKLAWLFSLVAVGVAIDGQLPWHDWGGRLAVATTTTALALMVAAMALMRSLRTFARETDEQEAVVTRERHRSTVRRLVARQAAEDARIMHDTLINTLSALATGGPALTDTTLVRARCARDVEAVEALLAGQEDLGRRDEAFELPEGFELRRTGLQDVELERYAALVPADVMRAVQGAVHELLRNAVKHSGGHCVDLDVRHEGPTIVVTVADRGRGFDGRLIAGRGLAESVVARARDAGVAVSIRTAPGAGTTARLVIPLGSVAAADTPAEESTTGPIVEQARRTACWSWATIMVGFGVASVMVNPPDSAIAASTMLAVVSGLSLAVWVACRDGGTLPDALAVLVLAGIPIAFVAGFAACDFGKGDISDWSTIVMTPLLVLLLVTRRSRLAFAIGVLLLVLTSAAAAFLVWRVTPSATAIAPAGAAIQLVVLGAWLAFYQLIDAIGARHEGIQRQLAEDRAEQQARDRVAKARARWLVAGTQASLGVLRSIARGEVDPHGAQLRRQCAEVERNLRQILLLSPEIVHLSPWLGQAMAAAHAKAVSLVMRGCTQDAPDDELAGYLGQAILDAVDTVEPGSELSIGLFPGGVGPRLLIVAPGGSLTRMTGRSNLPETLRLSYQRLEAQDLVELC